VSALEAVFRWHAPPGENETTLAIVPPAGSGPRYLSSVEVRAGGSGIVRLSFQLHGRNIRGYHTICVQNAHLTLRCAAPPADNIVCRWAVTAYEPARALREVETHCLDRHPGEPMLFELADLTPVDPYTKQVQL
jgi:hypothetical protein